MKIISPTKIMLFGTFDILHPGHIHFFKQVRKLAKNPFLIVSIARDINVKRIKGKKPQNNEKKRMLEVSKNALVNKVVLGAPVKYIDHIVREKPDIIALGYDQDHYVKNLKEQLLAKGLKVKIVRMKPHKPDIYKTSKLIGKK
jgi:FAD synthetase